MPLLRKRAVRKLTQMTNFLRRRGSYGENGKVPAASRWFRKAHCGCLERAQCSTPAEAQGSPVDSLAAGEAAPAGLTQRERMNNT